MQKQFNEKNQKHKNVEAQERLNVISEVKKEKMLVKLSIYKNLFLNCPFNIFSANILFLIAKYICLYLSM